MIIALYFGVVLFAHFLSSSTYLLLDPACSFIYSQKHHQLDLRPPATLPDISSRRKHIRHSPNFLYTARGLPHCWHLVLCRTGFELIGSLASTFWALAIAS